MTTGPVGDPADGPSANPSIPHLGGCVGLRDVVPHVASGTTNLSRLSGCTDVPTAQPPSSRPTRPTKATGTTRSGSTRRCSSSSMRAAVTRTPALISVSTASRCAAANRSRRLRPTSRARHVSPTAGRSIARRSPSLPGRSWRGQHCADCSPGLYALGTAAWSATQPGCPRPQD